MASLNNFSLNNITNTIKNILDKTTIDEKVGQAVSSAQRGLQKQFREKVALPYIQLQRESRSTQAPFAQRLKSAKLEVPAQAMSSIVGPGIKSAGRLLSRGIYDQPVLTPLKIGSLIGAGVTGLATGQGLTPAMNLAKKQQQLGSNLANIKDVGNVAPLAGLAMNPVGSIASGLVGSTLNAGGQKLFGGKITNQGLVEGAKTGMQYGTLGRLSQPVINAGLSKLSLPIAGRAAAAGAEALQGIGMDIAAGQEVTPLSVGIDLAQGAIAGGRTGNRNVKKTAENFVQYAGKHGKQLVFNPKEIMNTEDLNLVDFVLEQINKTKDLNSQNANFLRNVLKTVSNASDDAIDNMSANKIINEVVRHANLADDFRATTDNFDIPKLGFAAQRKMPKIRQEIKDNIIEVPDFVKDSTDNIGEKLKQTAKKLTLDDTVQKTREADVTADFDGKGRGFKSFADDLKGAWQNFVNNRLASNTQGEKIRQELSKFDDNNMDNIYAYQKNSNDPRFAPVKEYFKNMRKTLIDAGIDVKEKADYLTQIWDNTEEEIQQAVGKKLNLKPSFTMQSIIENYKAGVEAGLTPKFKNISEIASFYEKTARRALADKSFFNYLINEGLIQKSSKPGWDTLDTKRFAGFKVKLPGGGEYGGSFYAPKNLSKVINDYLREDNSNLKKIADTVSRIKNVSLTAGVPGTAFNFHGVANLSPRAILSGALSPAEVANDIFRPKSAEKKFNEMIDTAIQAQKYGTTFSAGERPAKGWGDNFLQKIGGKLLETQDNLFEKPLFDQVVPYWKTKMWKGQYERLLKQGFDQDVAGKKAAEYTNNMIGGINTDEIGRSKEFNNLLRVTLLAPDWLQTNLNIGKEAVKSLFDYKSPEGKLYRKYLGYLGMGLASAEMLNYITTGHSTLQNPPGKEMQIYIGKDPISGKDIYLKPFGTGADFLRLPIQGIRGILDNNFQRTTNIIANRINPVLSTMLHIMTNQDYAGRPLHSKNQYGREISPIQGVKNVAGEVLKPITPGYIQGALGFATGQLSPLEAITETIEAPVGYGYSKTPINGVAETPGSKMGGGIKQLLGIKTPTENVAGATDIKPEALSKKHENAMKVLNTYQDKLADIESDSTYQYVEDRQRDIDALNAKYEQAKADVTSVWQTNIDGRYDKYLGIDEVVNMPKSTRAQKVSRENEAYKVSSKLINRLENPKEFDLPQEEIKKAIEKMGISYDSAKYYYDASKTVDEKTAMLLDEISQLPNKDRGGMLKALINGRREVNGKQIVSSGVLSEFKDRGIISDQEYKDLKSFTFEDGAENSQPKVKITGRGSGATTKKSKVIKPLQKLAPVKLKFKTPSVKTVKGLKPIQQTTNVAQTPIQTTQPDLKKIQQSIAQIKAIRPNL